MASPFFPATCALTFEGTADHAGVWYDLQGVSLAPPFLCHQWPVVQNTVPDDIMQVFPTLNFEAAFSQTRSCDQQWHVLASFADSALTDCDVDSSSRHLPWWPTQQLRVVHKAASCCEPLELRRLRRLHRRSTQAALRGSHGALDSAICRSVRDLCPAFPVLLSLSRSCFTAHAGAQLVHQCLVECEQTLRSERADVRRRSPLRSSVPGLRTVLTCLLSVPGFRPFVEAAATRQLRPDSVLGQEVPR